MGDSEAPSTSDDDPVVKEIPIFHSKRLEDALYLFQYPLRPKDCTDDVNVRKCFFKPKSQTVKLEIGINVEAPNFDTVRAEYIAEEVDGGAKKDVTFENEIVDKVIYTSTKAVHDAKKYAAAIFNGKEIHLTGLKGILQLRPSFPYLDKKVGKKRRSENVDDVSDDEQKPGPSNAQQVLVKFKQPENERWKKSKVNKCDDEIWKGCKWHSEKSAFSEIQKLKLFAENTEDTGQAKNLTNSEYVRILVPEDKEQTAVTPCLPSHVMSLHALRSLPVQEQCKLLLKDAKIIQFQQIMMLLAGGDGSTVDSLLKALPKVAVLVQGNWIVKSDILYPAGSFSAISGVPADLMCRARDYVLLLFKQNQFVERRKVSSITRIPSEEIKEIFTGIGKLRHNKGWELALPSDVDFIGKHTDVVQRQNLLWDQRSKQLTDFFASTKDKKQRRKSKSVSDDSKVKCDGRDCGVNGESDADVPKSPVAKRMKFSKLNNEGVNKSESVAVKS